MQKYFHNFASNQTMAEENGVPHPSINNVKARFSVHPSEIDLLRSKVIKFASRPPQDIPLKPLTYFLRRKDPKKYSKSISLRRKEKKRKQEFKQHHNFIVFRGKHTYIVFTQSGTVNVTGVRCLCGVNNAVMEFCSNFGVNIDLITEPVIDNITATGSFNRYINLAKLKRLVNNDENISPIISISSNPNYFPSAFCRTIGSTTCSIFEKGTYNVVGAKCRADIQEIMKEMAALILRL
jgi:TATA-box binding protein (TBP) (component of TFIID and TFIIIB)